MDLQTENKKIVTVLNRWFANDPMLHVIERLPYVDGLGRRRVIDYAIVFRHSESPKVALILAPPVSENRAQLQKELDLVIHLLSGQGWFPVLVSPQELMSCAFGVEDRIRALLYPERTVLQKRMVPFTYQSRKLPA